MQIHREKKNCVQWKSWKDSFRCTQFAIIYRFRAGLMSFKIALDLFFYLGMELNLLLFVFKRIV